MSILHVGLPLDHPMIPPDDRAAVAERLAALQQRMRDAGYIYEILCISPEHGAKDLREQLDARPWDGVLIGGGILGTPALACFMDQIVDAIHETAPAAKILRYDHSEEIHTMITRCFPSPARDT